MKRLINRLGQYIITTPDDIAEKMVELIPEECFNSKTTFFDPCVKSGVFLYMIKDKLYKHPKLIEEFPDKSERIKHIEKNQLYGMCWNKAMYDEACNNINGKAVIRGNIVLVENLLAQVKSKKSFKEIIKGAFGKEMTFDIVIGNPPYNNDLYLDFVTQGHKAAKQCSIWITPAKWQAKGGGQRTKHFVVI